MLPDIEMGKGKAEWGVKGDHRKNFRMQTVKCCKYKFVPTAITERKTDSNKNIFHARGEKRTK